MPVPEKSAFQLGVNYPWRSYGRDFGAAGGAIFGFGRGGGNFTCGAFGGGIAGAANFPAAGAAAASSASDEAMNFSRAMICVYGLGPTGACGITGAL